jgi:hypothetical protein
MGRKIVAKTSLSLTPFLFTSEKELQATKVEGGTGEGSWFAMWINPQSINIDFKTNAAQRYTGKGYEYFHWHNALPVVTFEGVSGWLFSDLGGQEGGTFTGNFFKSVFELKKPTKESVVDPVLQQAFPGSEDGAKSALSRAFNDGIESVSTVIANSARLFVQRMQRVALQEKFYFDTERGYTIYNNRKIRIFTKAYPEGKDLEGYFTSFSIPESADDVQYVKYQATFVVEKGLEVKETEQFSLLQKFRSKSFFGLTNESILR